MNIEDELISRASSLTCDNLTLSVTSDMSKEERRAVFLDGLKSVREQGKLRSQHRTGNDTNIPKASAEAARTRLKARKKRLSLRNK